MDERPRTNPGGDAVGMTIDFAATRVDGSFSLVYVVFNTIIESKDPVTQVARFRTPRITLSLVGASSSR